MLHKIHINNIIQTSLQLTHVVRIPLHHFPVFIHILSIVIRSPSRVFINVGKLSFNPR